MMLQISLSFRYRKRKEFTTPARANKVKMSGKAFFFNHFSRGMTLLKELLKLIQVILSEIGGGLR